MTPRQTPWLLSGSRPPGSSAASPGPLSGGGPTGAWGPGSLALLLGPGAAGLPEASIAHGGRLPTAGRPLTGREARRDRTEIAAHGRAGPAGERSRWTRSRSWWTVPATACVTPQRGDRRLQRRGHWQGRWPAAGHRRLRRRTADAGRSRPAGGRGPPDGHAASRFDCDDVCEIRLAHVEVCRHGQLSCTRTIILAGRRVRRRGLSWGCSRPQSRK